MLDISIENAEKSRSRFNSLAATTPAIVEEKVDGTKLTLIRNDEPWCEDATKNWIVAYKTYIIYPEEFDGLTDAHDIAGKSIGTSQYKFVWDHLRAMHITTQHMKTNVELFIEYVMRKPTLTREYNRLHQLVMLGGSPTKYKIKGGRVFSNPESFDPVMLNTYSRILYLNRPRVVFKGRIPGPDAVETAKLFFKDTDSVFGGKVEGVVVTFETGEKFKLVQDDQYDVATRRAIKAKYEPLNRTFYWDSVRMAAEFKLMNIDDKLGLQQALSELSKSVYGGAALTFDQDRHGIRTQDDIFLTAKDILIRRTKGNNGALFIGRFAPLTIAHYHIIEYALRMYDTVTVNIVKSRLDSSNPFGVELTKKMLEACFGDRIEVTVSTVGTVSTILQKSQNVINVLLAGTDRVENYSNQLRYDHNVRVVEVPRRDDVSGTLVRRYLRNGDREMFNKYVPKPVAAMYEELKSTIERTQ